MALATFKIEQSLGGFFRQKLIDSGPSAIWPLDDTFGGTVRELIANRVGDSDNVSRGDIGAAIPEYGSRSGFNGTSSFFSVPTSASFQPSTTVAAAFIIKFLSAPAGTWTIFRKENGGTGGRIACFIDISGADTRINISVNIGATLRTVTAVIDPAAWQSDYRLILTRYDGTNLQIIQVTMAGVVSTLATSAFTGAVANGTPSALYWGANAGASEFANIGLQWCAWWTDDYPTDAENTAFGAALVWTNITPDVNINANIELEYGIRDTGPKARVAETGIMQFSLKNGDNNSAGLVGYYSPDHANRRAGFGFGNLVRFSITDPASGLVYRKMVGRLVGINPLPGVVGKRVTECLVVDYLDELARATLTQMPFAEGDYPSGLTTGEAITKTIQKLPVHPFDVDGSSSGTAEVFPYGYDRSIDEKEMVLEILKKIIDSELGWCYPKGDQNQGVFKIDTRQSRQLDVTPDFTLSNTMHELDVERTREQVITRVQVTVHPRDIDAAATTVLFTMDIDNQQPSIAPGQFIIIRAPYTDPTSRGQRMGGTALVTPVATTDYQGNSSADGTGTDLTASLTVSYVDENGLAINSADVGANSAMLKLSNGHASSTIYIRKCQIRGKGVRTYDPVVCEVANQNLRGKLGDNVLAIDQPFQDEVDAGYDAAGYLLSVYDEEKTTVKSLMLKAGSGSTAAIQTAAITGEPGDLVAITETVTGLAADEYFINGIKMSIRPGGRIDTTWIMARREMTSWILGVAGYSELGETTFLGF